MSQYVMRRCGPRRGCASRRAGPCGGGPGLRRHGPRREHAARRPGGAPRRRPAGRWSTPRPRLDRLDRREPSAGPRTYRVMSPPEETMTSETEADLAERLRAGDPDAVTVLFDRHADRV